MYILQNEPTFSILHYHYYKIFTSIYLFYTIFYLNNTFLTFFIISHLPTTHQPLTRVIFFFFFSFSFFLLLLILLFPPPFSSSPSSSISIWVQFWMVVLGGFLHYCEWLFWAKFRQISPLSLLLLLLHLLLPLQHFLLLLLLLHFGFD